MARREQVDYYALLQLTPRATNQEIEAAYQRLRDLYSPARTADAAPELQALSAEKYRQLELAFEVLRDPLRRAAYDQKRGFATGSGETLDYRPLPPARGEERTDGGDVTQERVRPVRSTRSHGWRAWITPVLLASTTLALLLLVVLSGVRTTDGRSALATPTIQGVVLPYTDEEINQLAVAAQSQNTATTWSELGNALFDNLQTMREQAPYAPQYRGQLGRWLDVAQAYERSLELEENATVRSDRAIALFNYGQDAPDPQRVNEALAEVERGVAEKVTAPRALINYGLILAQVQPPRHDEAFEQWRKVREVAPQSPEVQAAERLLQSYGQS